MKQDKERYDKFKENDKLRKWTAKKNKEKEVIVLEAVNAEVLAQGETSTLICLKAPIKRQKSYQGWQQPSNRFAAKSQKTSQGVEQAREDLAN